MIIARWLVWMSAATFCLTGYGLPEKSEAVNEHRHVETRIVSCPQCTVKCASGSVLWASEDITILCGE